MRQIMFRLAGTVLLAGILLLRLARILGNLESVRSFYPGTYGSLWSLVELALFFGPFLVTGSAAAALWLRWDRAGKLGTVNICAAAFFVFEEGLIVFARWMDGNGGYVGAEPLFSAIVCAVSIAAVLRAHRAGGWKRGKR